MKYSKFGFMMLMSFIVMYIVMFLNIDRFSHFHNSLTRLYMALLMVAPMAIIMMMMMSKMFPSAKINTVIMITSIVVLIGSLIGLRTQTPIGDVQYMKAMIPHHSSAIMVSKNANIQDPEVKELSLQIIKSQEEEIAEMNKLLKKLE